MPRRKKQDDELEEIIPRLGLAVIIMFVLYLVYLKNLHPDKFVLTLVIGVMILMFIFSIPIFIYFHNIKQVQKLQKTIESSGLNDEINNYINRFGKEKNRESWYYRNYYFDEDRMNDFVQSLKHREPSISNKYFKKILQNRIDVIESELTVNSVSPGVKNFNSLSGAEFEILLKRLFEAMGFSVQITGRSGDQGGDLIANRNGKRFLVQAKRYAGSVSNSAVQQAVAAKTHYDCSSAVVVSTGEYTKGARELAKSNSVQLIGKSELQMKLKDYLQENWS
jgi:HJR/Mrr/RecB family endonuclease